MAKERTWALPMKWKDFEECIHSADDKKDIITCIADFHEREPTGLTNDIIGICKYRKDDEEVEACLEGSVQSLALIGSPEKNDFTTDYETVEDTVVEIDNFKRVVTD